MKNEVLQVIDIKSVLTNSLIAIGLGLVLALVPMSSLVSVVVLIIGILMVILNGIRVYKEIMEKDNSTNEMLLNILGALFGFLLITFNSKVMIILASIYLIIKPIIYLILTKFDREIAMLELPKSVLGLVLLCSGFTLVDKFFRAIGIILIVASVGYLLVNYIFYKKSGIKIK